MRRVTSTEFQQSVGTYSDSAMREPVVITSHSRDRLVLLNVEEFNRLKEMEEQMTDEEKKIMDERFDVHRETLAKLAHR